MKILFYLLVFEFVKLIFEYIWIYLKWKCSCRLFFCTTKKKKEKYYSVVELSFFFHILYNSYTHHHITYSTHVWNYYTIFKNICNLTCNIALIFFFQTQECSVHTYKIIFFFTFFYRKCTNITGSSYKNTCQVYGKIRNERRQNWKQGSGKFLFSFF